MKNKQPVSFVIAIVLMWTLPAMSTDIYLPSMPVMASFFNTTISQIQLTIFFYTAGFSIGALFFGPISDRIGRRPVVLGSLIFSAITSLVACLAPDLTILFIARFCQGVALVGVASTMRAITKDISPDSESMAKFGAILGIAIPIAAALAPIIGGYIEKYLNWRVSFGFLFVYVVIFLIYAIKKFPETNHDKLERPFKYLLLDYQEVLLNRQFFSYNTVTAMSLSAMYAYLTISPTLMQIKCHLDPEEFGYTNILISLALVASSFLNSKLIRRFGINRLIKAGVKIIGISGMLLVIGGIIPSSNPIIILIPVTIMAFGCGLIFPNASAGGMSIFAKSAGTAGAIYACVQMLGGSMGSGLISLLSHTYDAQLCLGVLFIIQTFIGLIAVSYLTKHDISH